MAKLKGRGAKPGENRFKSRQETLISNTTAEINVTLSRLNTKGTFIRNITHLASLIAEDISSTREDFRKKMAPSTLLRSPVYRKLLEDHLSSTPTGSAQTGQFRTLLSTLEKNHLHDLQIENTRLRRYIENSLPDTSKSPLPQPQRQTNPDIVINQLCRSIALLIEASGGQFASDLDTGEIINVWARSKKKRIVVSREMAKTYIEWQKAFPVLVSSPNLDSAS